LDKNLQSLNRMILATAGLGTLATIAIGLLLSMVLWKPLRRIISAVTERDPEGLATYEPSSELIEVHALEVSLAKMGSRLVDLMEKQRRAQVDAAIARMIGMLAHDVRRPFSILRIGLNMLRSAKDPEGVKKVMTRLVPEIEKAVGSVDGLIADVLEVGSTSTTLIKESVRVESLIEAAIADLVVEYPNAKFDFLYALRHQASVSAHVTKVGRVFANILSNAAQAMSCGGQIWFKARDLSHGFVEICVGNSGSLIPTNNLPLLFDAFFTSGKKIGTGLGLAIAKKIITAHGGTIWCESAETADYPQGKVEFFFTLPMSADAAVPFAGRLPGSTLEYAGDSSVSRSHGGGLGALLSAPYRA